MTAIFITGTGTDVGKTYVTAALIRHLRQMGRSVEALKPVVSGFDPALPATSDPGVLLKALGFSVTPQDIERIAPWRYRAPLSPDLAAQREGQTIDVDGVITFCRTAIEQRRDILLIEGVGGIMVPLDDQRTVLDLMMALQLPLILVAGSYLGTISHTLTALDALFRRNLKVLATIVSETPQFDGAACRFRRGNCALRQSGDWPAAAKVWPNRWRRNAPGRESRPHRCRIRPYLQRAGLILGSPTGREALTTRESTMAAASIELSSWPNNFTSFSWAQRPERP